VRPEIPFHVLLAVSEHLKSKRAQWNVPLFKK